MSKTSGSNIIIFGASGAGKSSLINVIVGNEKAKISSSAGGCTSEAQAFDATIDPGLGSVYPPRTVKLWDTVGLHDRQLGREAWLSTAAEAYKLTKELRGNISLLVFCLEAGGSTASIRSNYHLVYSVFCQEQVPLVCVITHLENELNMDDWWSQNKKIFRGYDESIGHACVTTYHGEDAEPQKVRESEEKLRKLIYDSAGKKPKTTISKRIMPFLSSTKPKSPYSRDEMMKALQNKCKMPQEDAKDLAERLVPADDGKPSVESAPELSAPGEPALVEDGKPSAEPAPGENGKPAESAPADNEKPAESVPEEDGKPLTESAPGDNGTQVGSTSAESAPEESAQEEGVKPLAESASGDNGKPVESTLAESTLAESAPRESALADKSAESAPEEDGKPQGESAPENSDEK